MSITLTGPGQLPLLGSGAPALVTASAAASSNFPMSLSLTNYDPLNTVAAPVVTIGMAFAQGDIPAGSRLKMSTAGGAQIVMQEDAIASWGDGSRKFSALSFTSPDTFQPNGTSGATNAYTLSVENVAPNTTPAFTLSAFVAANDIKVLFSGFDCGANVFACSFNQIVASFAQSPYEGQFVVAQAAAAGATRVTLVSAGHVSIGMAVSGVGVAANTLVTSVSGNVVQLSTALTLRISAGVALEFGSALGGYETLCSGPNCMEWKAWSYLQAISGPNAGAYHTQVRCTLYVRAWGLTGPHEIYAQVMIPNVYGNIPGGTVGPAGSVGKRFVANATVQNGSTILYYFGGPNDKRTFTVPPSDFNSDGSLTIASPPNWLHMNTYGGAGVSFSSTGTLPGDLSSTTACWLVPTGTANTAYIWVWRLMSAGSSSGTWAANTAYPGETIVFSDSGTYATITGGTSGTVAPAGPGPVSDGTVTWIRLSAANFTSAGTGTISLMPTLSVFPIASAVLAAATGEPIWDQGSSAFAVRPHLMPSFNQKYLCHQTKFTLPYDLSQTTYPRTSNNLVDRGITNTYTEYSPGQSQPWGWVISAYGDDPGDERVGYFSSSNAWSVYQQSDPITDLIIRSEALGFADYPYVTLNEKSGQPPVTNAGPDRSPDGRPYPGLGPLDLSLTSTSLNTVGEFPVTFPAQFGPDWSGHQDTYGPIIDEEHMPLLFSMPYLRTGHRIYLDNAIMLATSLLLAVPARSAVVGNLTFWGSLGYDNSGQLRGIAWRIKLVGQSYHMMPDNNLVRPFFSDWLDDTAAYFQAYFPNNVIPKQAAPLGLLAIAENPGGGIPAYMYSFLVVVVSMEAWRDAIDDRRPQWRDWLINYAARFNIKVFDVDQGGGLHNLPQGDFTVYFGTDPSGCFQTPAQLWSASFNVQGGAPTAAGFSNGACTGSGNYPYDTDGYATIWACGMALMSWVGVPKAQIMFDRFRTTALNPPCAGILWAQNATNSHYDLNTAQSYMPWCCAPPGDTMPSALS